MARIRKSARLLRDPAIRALSASCLHEISGPVFTLEPADLFTRQAPLELELGPGKGDFIIARAAAFLDRNFLAVEISGAISRLLSARAGRAGIPNIKVVKADSRTIVNLILPSQSVDVYHIYFPDPWPKEKHAKHRLFSPFFVANLGRTLKTEGVIHTATDVREYASTISALLGEAGFRQVELTAGGETASNFGRKYKSAGRSIFAVSFAFFSPFEPRSPQSDHDATITGR